MPFTTYEALARLAHRVAVSETERTEMEATFLNAFGAQDEKDRFYKESEADKATREAKERFDAAVADEVKKRQDAAQQQAAVTAAADAQTAQTAPVNATPVAASA